MEFEKSSQDTSPEVSDMERLAASNRRITINPVSPDVIADDMPDEYIVNQHIIEGPIANIATDSEVTAARTPVQAQQPSRKARSAAIVVSIVIIIAAIVLGAVFAYLTSRH